MFAFALYDSERDELVLARDRLGIKPLYYVALADRVAFASEIKTLLSLLPGGPRVEAGALAQFLENQFVTGEATIVEGVRRVPPATVMTIDSGLTIRTRSYWSPSEAPETPADPEEASEAFDALIERVMREHMRADVPYGLFLSGGVDSAVLLAMLHRYQDRPVRTFSVGWKDASIPDELDAAGKIAERFGAEHTAIALDSDAVFRRLPHTVWAADDLLRDYACLPTSVLAERAAHDRKVVFTGEGGDEAFAGYGRYRQSVLARALKGVLAPGSGGFRTRSQIRPRWIRELYGARLETARRAAREPFVSAWSSAPRSWSFTRRAQLTDLVTNLPDNLLVKADRMLMSFGVEGRVPFCDHRVVEFGLGLPDRLKVGNGQGKLFLKRWAERDLPSDHLYRRKRGFHVPVPEWLGDSFLDRLAAVLPANAAIREWFRPEGVARLLEAQRRKGGSSREVWCLMQFAIWHRIFVDGTAGEPEPESDPIVWIGGGHSRGSSPSARR